MTKNPSFTLFPIYISVFFLCAATPDPPSGMANEFVVVLDAGHGGYDPGNLGNGYLEKDIVLAIVLKTGAELEKIPGVKVVYTRDDDVFVDLYKRGEIANKENADLFVSVHCDSHNSNAYGAGTFVLGLHANKQNFEVAKKENSVIYLEDGYEERYAQYDIDSPESLIGMTIMQEEFLEQSMQFAGLLQKQFTEQLKRKDRKVKQAGFIVLHQTFMPSVLVETGFLTHKGEGAYLSSKKGQQEIANAIVNAVVAYKKGVQRQEPLANEAPPKINIPKPIMGEENNAPSTKPIEERATAINVAPKTNNANAVHFRVQLMASKETFALTPKNFKGLGDLSTEQYKEYTRYMYGRTTSYKKAKELRATGEAKGFKGCYIVAYKNGVRIPVKQAVGLIDQ